MRLAEARRSGDGAEAERLLNEVARTAATLHTLQGIHRDLQELQALLKQCAGREMGSGGGRHPDDRSP